mgnify:CR=1 FL=1
MVILLMGAQRVGLSLSLVQLVLVSKPASNMTFVSINQIRFNESNYSSLYWIKYHQSIPTMQPHSKRAKNLEGRF